MMRHLIMLALLVSTASTVPDLAGTWTLDGFMGGGPLGLPAANSICAPTSETPDGAGSEQLQSIGTVTGELVIVQTPAAITIDRRYGGSIASGTWKTIVNLDGSETTTVNGPSTVIAKGRWEGATLVLDQRIVVKKDGAETATCTVRETIGIDSDGMLKVTASSDGGGRQRTSRQSYFRKKAPGPRPSALR